MFDNDDPIVVNTTIFDPTSGVGLPRFNPFTEAPVEGVNWRKGSQFGRGTRTTDFQTPTDLPFLGRPPVLASSSVAALPGSARASAAARVPAALPTAPRSVRRSGALGSSSPPFDRVWVDSEARGLIPSTALNSRSPSP